MSSSSPCFLFLFFVIVLTTTIFSSAVSSLENRPLRLLFFGDSIMHCSGLKGNFTSGYLSYRLPLMQKLVRHAQKTEISFETVGPHVGCNARLDANLNTIEQFGGEKYSRSSTFFGRPLAEGAHDLKRMLRDTQPDILIFSLGTNDVIKGWGPDRMLIFYEKAFDNILRYRDEGNQPGMKTLFLNLIPLDVNRPKVVRKFRKANQRLADTNEAIMKRFFSTPIILPPDPNDDQDTVKNETKLFPLQVKSVSLYDSKNSKKENDESGNIFLLRVDEGFFPRSMTYDAIHPNEEGERFLADKIYPALKHLVFSSKGDEKKTRVRVDDEQQPQKNIEREIDHLSTSSKKILESQDADFSMMLVPVGLVLILGVMMIWRRKK